MVVIQSIEQDLSTNEVIRWLIHLNQLFIRLNDITILKNIKYSDKNYNITFSDGREINTRDIISYWYRRGIFKNNIKISELGIPDFDITYQNYIIDESKSVYDSFIWHLKNRVFSIGDSILGLEINKNTTLEIAKDSGFLVPEYIITTRKSDLLTFITKNQKVITKPIHSAFTYKTDNFWYPTYTEYISEERLDKTPDVFQPSLFQQMIEKKVEIRCFYLLGECYSMAIFSQNDTQTQTDFRVYNTNKPNRNVPFSLPEEITAKIDILMKKLRLESGSLDIIYSTDKNFYFLEVNPIGQFGMVSYPCNYYLEKLIAQKLKDGKK